MASVKKLSSRVRYNDLVGDPSFAMVSTPDQFKKLYGSTIVQKMKKDKTLGTMVTQRWNLSDFASKEDFLTAVMEWNHSIESKNASVIQTKLARAQAVKAALTTKATTLEKDAKGAEKAVLDNPEKKDEQKIEEHAEKVLEQVAPEANEPQPTAEDPTDFPKINLAGIFSLPDFVKYQAAGSGSTFFFVGSSKSGKSTAMIEFGIMYKERYPETVIILVSETQRANGGIYKPLIDKAGDHMIIAKPNLPDVVKFVEKLQKRNSDPVPILILIDDMVTGKNSPEMKKLFVTLRNLNVSTALAAQTVRMFSKDNRSNVNYIFAGRLNNSEIAEDMYDIFLKGVVPWNKKNAIEEYDKVTNGYNKLFVDQLNDKVYSYG